jgi:tetratricopeptide (TPR) repeat protein
VEDIFAVQDEIVESVAVVLEPEIRRAEIQRSHRERPGSAAAYDLYLQGLARLNTNAIEDNAVAFDLFSRALEMDPENGVFMIYTAWALNLGHAMGWSGIDTSRARQVDLARRAVQASPRDGDVLVRAALTLIHASREYDLAGAMITQALESNPNAFWVIHCAGVWHLHCGDLDKALHYFQRVTELSPNDPDLSHTLAGVAHTYMAMGRYEDAVDWAERALVLNRNWSATYWMLVAGNAQLGRLEEARRYLAQFLEVTPETTIAAIRAGQPAKIPGRIEPILDGLRLAGLPEA